MQHHVTHVHFLALGISCPFSGVSKPDNEYYCFKQNSEGLSPFSSQSFIHVFFLLFSRCVVNIEFNFLSKLLLRLSASGLHSNPAHDLSVALSCFSCWGGSPGFPLPSSCVFPVEGEALLVQKSRWFEIFPSFIR